MGTLLMVALRFLFSNGSKRDTYVHLSGPGLRSSGPWDDGEWVASTGSGGESVQVLSYRAGRGLVRWAGRWVMSHSSRDAGQLNWCDHSFEISEPGVGAHDWACVVSLGPNDAVETEVGPLSELLRKYE